MQMLRRARGVTKDIDRNGCTRKDQRVAAIKIKKEIKEYHLKMLWT